MEINLHYVLFFIRYNEIKRKNYLCKDNLTLYQFQPMITPLEANKLIKLFIIKKFVLHHQIITNKRNSIK